MVDVLAAPPLSIPSPPWWWVSKGGNMRVVEKDLANGRLLIASAADHAVASLLISHDPDDSNLENLKWSLSGDVEVAGYISMESFHVQRAFGYISKTDRKYDRSTPSGHAIATRLNIPVSAAAQNRYFRHGQYLNIPGPGLGAQGDPNLSILVTQEMRADVEEFLATRKPA